jgi:predicted Rossmann fold flavoprotein
VAAIFAAGDGAETVLLERTRDGGRKILISGGGRCNVLPMRLDETRFVTDSSPNLLRKMLPSRLDERRFVTSSSPHSVRNIVRSWPLADQIAFFEREVGIPLVEEPESAKLFPVSQRARDVRDGLLRLAIRRGVRFLPNTLVTDLTPIASGWRVALDGAAPLDSDSVIVATGGLSVPTTGSDGRGLDILARLGHVVHPTYPALTPLLADGSGLAHLAGVSVPVAIAATSAIATAASSGGFLFTHRGYSGPAVLDVSHVAVRARGEGIPAALRVRWGAPEASEWDGALAPTGGRTVLGTLREQLPERLAAALIGRAGVEPSRPLAQLRREERRRLLEVLTRGELPWTGDEGYRKAEVTGGGVSLAELHPRTLESRRHPGLHLCGELLDAFGPIGGYNFLWAWATGRLAGIGVHR